MAAIKDIKKKFGGLICRSCINKEYNVNLNRSDCIYGIPFPDICRCCEEHKNIVTDFTFGGKLKMLFK